MCLAIAGTPQSKSEDGCDLSLFCGIAVSLVTDCCHVAPTAMKCRSKSRQFRDMTGRIFFHLNHIKGAAFGKTLFHSVVAISDRLPASSGKLSFQVFGGEVTRLIHARCVDDGIRVIEIAHINTLTLALGASLF